MDTQAINTNDQFTELLQDLSINLDEAAGVHPDNTEEPSEEVPAPDILPENSKTLEYNDFTVRFSGAEWFHKIQDLDVILAGVGGIGSYVAFLLSRIRPNSLYIFDPDRVEAVNMAGQLYCQSDIGRSKTDAIARMMHNYSNYYCGTSRSNYDRDSISKDVMICGFDNMEARKVFFQKWFNRVEERGDKEKLLYIDGRLSAEEFQVYCIVGNDEYSIKRYQDTLFSDGEAENTICSYKQTTFMSNMIGSIMVNLLVNFAANLCDPLIPRPTPFMTYYDATLMHFKTID